MPVSKTSVLETLASFVLVFELRITRVISKFLNPMSVESLWCFSNLESKSFVSNIYDTSHDMF